MNIGEIRTIADFSARAVNQELHIKNQTENQKVDFLWKHFDFDINLTRDAIICMFNYYANLHVSLELDYEHLLKLRVLYPPEFKSQWNMFLQLAINRSKNLSKEEKLDLLFHEMCPHFFIHESPVYNRLPNYIILKGISRDFLSGLSDEEFDHEQKALSIKAYYEGSSQTRYNAILEARDAAKKRQPTVIAEVKSQEIEGDQPLPLPIYPTPVERHAERFKTLRTEAPLPSACAVIFAGAGAVGGFLLAGPVGAIVGGFAGFLVGTAIGFLGNALMELVRRQYIASKEKVKTSGATTPTITPPPSPPRSVRRSRDALTFLTSNTSINVNVFQDPAIVLTPS